MESKKESTPAKKAQPAPMQTAKELFSEPKIRERFEEILGKKAMPFMTSVLQIVNSSELLKKADPQSVYHVAVVAAGLDLPLNPKLGFAYIIPYEEYSKSLRKTIVTATFQMGYKGFIQLAQRTGLFHKINATHITDKDIIKGDRLLGEEFQFSNEVGVTIGYAAYFKLLNGFEKVLYMTVQDLEDHAKEFSKSYDSNDSMWKRDPYSMSIKTVIKLLLSRYAPLSVETQHIQTALLVDQAAIEDSNTMKLRYIDNEPDQPINKETERIIKLIENATTLQELEGYIEHIQLEQMELYKTKKQELEAKK